MRSPFGALVPIPPEVSPIITEVFVANNQVVSAGQALFQIESDTYQLAVDNAQATASATFFVNAFGHGWSARAVRTPAK